MRKVESLLGVERMERMKDNELQHKVEKKSMNHLGDGVVWRKGAMIGKGSFGSVYLANLKKHRSRCGYFPSVMAMKSAEVSVSGTIQKEREVLNNVRGCSDVLRCYGDETTTGENGEMVYNLLLEYGSGGTLADMIKKLGGNGLPESDVRRYARCILRGLSHIHGCGYIHCDLKPDNILLTSDLKAKIGDFGLAKRAGGSKKRKLEPYWRGTPLYLSPEAVVDNVQEPPSDIWALGCIVLEMLTGKHAWNGEQELNVENILKKIGNGHELTKIPLEISREGRDFLKGCFVRKEMFRFTAEMLLNHPFMEGIVDVDDIEDLEEVADVNEDSSLLILSMADDGLDSSSFSDDCSFFSEEESFSYWSENEEGPDNQEVCSFSEDGFGEEESRGVTFEFS
ncbi:unnamed protein product [Ilex paraguariensis]|uniref:Protein kinase domain-containing protein n=1 Tax=Ilex paraguariensis TaxID=185542 RepID=A0ABC8V0J0_9AQUA